jgi:hypothetical protein
MEASQARLRWSASMLVLVLTVAGAGQLAAQGVTTASISGSVLDTERRPLSGAMVTATHQPSGTVYQGVTRADGRFLIPGMRVGGPYMVRVQYIGYDIPARTNVQLNLGVATELAFNARVQAVAVEGIEVTAERNDAIFSPDRTGAATAVGRQAIEVLPTINRRIEDFARLTPQYSPAGFGFSFAGQDNRLNNLTIDGSYFNNSFGLAGQPGDRTRVAPISTQAIEQIHVNIAPFDVRQGNFVGAGVNAVTKSGTNDLAGSLYYQFRGDGNVGSGAKEELFNPGTFDFSHLGGWVSGPVLRNRLFFFAGYEQEERATPGTTFRANQGGETVAGSVTRVRRTSMDSLSTFLATNFGYETGGYQGYSFGTPATRYIGKLDFNLNERNKFSVRYTHLDSESDILVSNSSSLGFGTRRTVTTGLNFQNSNYAIMENIRSVVGEWNSMIGTNLSNNLIVGYTSHDESRKSRGDFFPFVDILDGSTVYTSFGFEPFTPNNELRYSSFQLQNNLSMQRGSHTLTFGASAERYESQNVFFPGSQSVYVYNSLDDFYRDANDYLANPNRTTSPVTLRRFQVRWMNVPGLDKPVQPLEVFYAGIYGQDEWRVNDRFQLTAGLRIDRPSFGHTAYANPNADRLTFRDEHNTPVQYSTGKLPDPKPLLSPRLGFNLAATEDRTTQVRGGTGIFTGRPAYVWISNQIGNTGVLTGFERLDNTTGRPFHPDPHHYKPTQVDGSPAASYELALTDANFRFPQLWRTNLAVDQRLPFGWSGTAEFLYSRDVNGIYYINANLPVANSKFEGADNRPRWTGPSCAVRVVSGVQVTDNPCVTRINNEVGNQVENAIVLKNQNEGYSWNMAGSLERSFATGLYTKLAYAYGVARNTVDPGSIAFGSWNNNQHSGDPNSPGVAFASTSPGHRVLGALSYTGEMVAGRKTTLTVFSQGYTIGNASYTFAGDLNGDGGTSNDLIYIHRDRSEMNFQTYCVNTGAAGACENTAHRTVTAEQQADAWDAFIRQDSYLSKNRGRYAERNAVFLPMVYRADLSLIQDLFIRNTPGRNAVQLRMDVINVGNMLNKNWGVSQRMVTTQPLLVPTTAQGGPADVQSRAQYRLRMINNQFIDRTFQQTVTEDDVYRIQFTLRYTFN